MMHTIMNINVVVVVLDVVVVKVVFVVVFVFVVKLVGDVAVKQSHKSIAVTEDYPGRRGQGQIFGINLH